MLSERKQGNKHVIFIQYNLHKSPFQLTVYTHFAEQKVLKFTIFMIYEYGSFNKINIKLNQGIHN